MQGVFFRLDEELTDPGTDDSLHLEKLALQNNPKIAISLEKHAGMPNRLEEMNRLSSNLIQLMKKYMSG